MELICLSLLVTVYYYSVTVSTDKEKLWKASLETCYNSLITICSRNAKPQPEPVTEHLVGRQGQSGAAQVHAMH